MKGGRIAASVVNYRQDNAPVEGEVGERVALIAETMQNSELLARRSAVATIPTTLAPSTCTLQCRSFRRCFYQGVSPSMSF